MIKLERRHCHLGVQVGRVRDEDRIHVLPVEDPSPVRERGRLLPGGSRGRLIEAIRLDIAQRQDSGVGLSTALQRAHVKASGDFGFADAGLMQFRFDLLTE